MKGTKTFWKKGRGKMGVLAPLLGTWKAEAMSPMGKIRCTADVRTRTRDRYIQLRARWEFGKGAYEEIALYGIKDGTLRSGRSRPTGRDRKGRSPTRARSTTRLSRSRRRCRPDGRG